MGALVGYMHAAAGFPVRSTWLKAIKNRNFNSWLELTYNNAEKYCPQSMETIKGHMVQSSQGVRFTKNMDRKVHNNKMENLNNNPTQMIVSQIKKHKKFTYGTNL